MKSKIIALLLIAVIVIAAAACGGGGPQQESSPPPSASASPPPESAAPESAAPETPSAEPAVDKDREGNPITLPDKIETIISMGPSNTEVLVELGFGDMIIASDDYSANVPGLPEGIPLFSMMAPDGEQIISLNPDVIFVTGMSKAYGDDPFKVVSDAGICVIYMPSSESIEGIKEDIRFLSAVMGARAAGDELVSWMESEIESIRKLGESVAGKKTVYFEIAAAPSMYSFGKGVFLNELIEICGAENVFANQDSWIAVSDEQILSLNPDVILTSVYYIDDPVGEILSRPGWDALTAVQNEAVYSIDGDASNRPSHNIIKALLEMSAAIYPDAD